MSDHSHLYQKTSRQLFWRSFFFGFPLTLAAGGLVWACIVYPALLVLPLAIGGLVIGVFACALVGELFRRNFLKEPR